MFITNDDRIIECKLKPELINSDDIEYDDFTYITYDDEELISKIVYWCCEIANQCDWVLHDPSRTKVSICLDENDVNKAQLYVCVEPPIYSNEEKIRILEMASTEPICLDDMYSEYDMYEFIFATADLFHRVGSNMEDNYDIFDVQFTDDERNWLVGILDNN